MAIQEYDYKRVRRNSKLTVIQSVLKLQGYISAKLQPHRTYHHSRRGYRKKKAPWAMLFANELVLCDRHAETVERKLEQCGERTPRSWKRELKHQCDLTFAHFASILMLL